MGLKLMVFGLLCGTVIQGFPQYILGKLGNNEQVAFQPLPSNWVKRTSVSNLVPEDKQKSCNEKLDWYKNVTEQVKGYYDLYYARFQQLKLNTDKVRDIEEKHTDFESMVEESLEKYKEDKKKFFNISENSLTATLCIKEISWFKVLNQHLTGIAENIRGDVSNFLEALGVPKETRDSLDATLAKVINYLMIIDLTKNTFKDLGSLAIELNKKTIKIEDGIKPEKENEIDPDDVQYGDEAIEPEVDTAKEIEDWSRINSDLEDKRAIEEAEFREKERVNEQKKKKTEIEERKAYEPSYEIKPSKV